MIVGLRKLDSGQVRVFDGVPDDGKIGVPGKNVGYMPQVHTLSNETRLKILQSPCPRRDAIEFINKVEFYILHLSKVLQGNLSYSKVPGPA